MVRGQDLPHWQEHAPVLADALLAHRVAVTRHRPGVVAIVVEREHAVHPRDPGPGDPGRLRRGGPVRARRRRQRARRTVHALDPARAPPRRRRHRIRQGLDHVVHRCARPDPASATASSGSTWSTSRAASRPSRARPCSTGYATTGLRRGRAADRLPRPDEGPSGVDARQRHPRVHAVAGDAGGAADDRRDGDAHRLRRPLRSSATRCGCWPRS